MAEQLEARTVMEAARLMGKRSMECMANTYAKMPSQLRPTSVEMQSMLSNRGQIVWDTYLTGAEEMLKMLMGDFTPEPWTDDYDHEARLTELLEKYRDVLRTAVVELATTDPIPARMIVKVYQDSETEYLPFEIPMPRGVVKVRDGIHLEVRP